MLKYLKLVKNICNLKLLFLLLYLNCIYVVGREMRDKCTLTISQTQSSERDMEERADAAQTQMDGNRSADRTYLGKLNN
jgi:hypothetical protein